MEFKDYYNILGVNEQATQNEIKKAYHRLARRYHPDVSKEKDAEQKFKEIGEAYEVLGDKEKRREYDQLRHMGAKGRDGRFEPPPGWESTGHFGDFESADFSDFFASIFGGRSDFDFHTRRGRAHGARQQAGREQFRKRGEDIHYELALLLEEAYKGGEQVIEVRVPVVNELGVTTYQNRKLSVKVPPGTGDGQILRVRGQGAPGIGGGEPGDLLVTVRLAEHPLYTVEGKDISLVVPVAPWEAALGAKVTVPTLEGKTRVSIPPDSQTGKKLRLAKKGLPGSPPGDFYVIVKVVMPEKSTSRSRELFEALAEEVPFNPRADWEEAKS